MTPDFPKLIRATSDARMRLRLLVISHFIDGRNRTQIAKFLKASRSSVNNWVKSYLDFGIEGLVEKQHTGYPSQLTEERILLNISKRSLTSFTACRVYIRY